MSKYLLCSFNVEHFNSIDDVYIIDGLPSQVGRKLKKDEKFVDFNNVLFIQRSSYERTDDLVITLKTGGVLKLETLDKDGEFAKKKLIKDFMTFRNNTSQ